MPIDLPVRKTLDWSPSVHRWLETCAVTLGAVFFTFALAELVSLTPQNYRAGLSNAVYEAMLQSP